MNTVKHQASLSQTNPASDAQGDLLNAATAAHPPAPSAASPQTAPTLPPSSLSLVQLDTGLIKTGETFNRLTDSLDTPEFESLVTSILQTRGNTQPIIVTPIPESDLTPGQRQRYTLVSGHRRWAACEMLGFKVLCVIREVPASADTLLDRLIENHHRQNLSPMEFGRQVHELMAQRSDLSARAIGKALGCDHSLVIKARDVAQLPEAVVACFPSPHDIRYKDADQLKQALQLDAESVIAEAKAIRAANETLTGSQIAQRLMQAAARAKAARETGLEGQGGEPFTTPDQEQADRPLLIDGKAVGRFAHDKKGRPMISLDVTLSQAQQTALAESIESFIRRRVLRSANAKSAATDSKQPATTANSEPATEAKRRVA